MEEKPLLVPLPTAKVICVCSLGVGAHHDAGVVDEDVDPVLLGVDLLGALADGLEAGEVALVDGDVGAGNLPPDVGSGRVGLIEVPSIIDA